MFGTEGSRQKEKFLGSGSRVCEDFQSCEVDWECGWAAYRLGQCLGMVGR